MITFINNSDKIENFYFNTESFFLVKKTPKEIISQITSVNKHSWIKKDNPQGSSLPETFRNAITEASSVIMIRNGKIKIYGKTHSYCVSTEIQPEYLDEKFKHKVAVA